MRSNNTQIQQNEIEGIFHTICRLAMNQNKAGLRSLLATGVNIQHHYQMMSPVEYLAKNRKVDAVNFLLDYFPADIHDAALGYVQAGMIDEVNVLLKRGASVEGIVHVAVFRPDLKRLLREFPLAGLVTFLDSINDDVSFSDDDFIIMNLANKGLVNKVEDLLKHGANIKSAVIGYAQSGYVDQVNDLLVRGANINAAVSGYIIAGYDSLVNMMMEKDVNIVSTAEFLYPQTANVAQIDNLLTKNPKMFNFHEINNYIFMLAIPDNALRLAVFASEQLRRQLSHMHFVLATDEQEFDVGEFKSDDALYVKATYIRLIMDSFDIGFREAYQLDLNFSQEQIKKMIDIKERYQLDSYGQAKALTIPSARAWLLNGSRLAKYGCHESNPTIPNNVYWEITSKLLNLTIKDTQVVFNAVHSQHKEKMKDVNLSHFKSGLFTQQQYDDEETRIDERNVARTFMTV